MSANSSKTAAQSLPTKTAQTDTLSASSSSPGVSTTKTFDLLRPKKQDRKVFVSKFSNSLEVDFASWRKSAPEFVREGAATEETSAAEEQAKTGPKGAAGSEFGKEKRDEARRRKYTRHKKMEDAPWIMTDTVTKKKYRGTREGGVQDNSAYYVFTTVGGRVEAYPVAEWYTFVPIQRYKALDADEAEEAFGKRDKVLNYFNIMYKKRLGKTDGDEGDDGGEEGGTGGKSGGGGRRKSNLKISEGDEDALPAEMSDSEEEGAAGDTEAIDGPKKGTRKSKVKAKKPIKKPKAKTRSHEDDFGEPAEESDDGDYETREVDYESSADELDDEETAEREDAPKAIDEEVEEMDDDEDEEDEKDEKEGIDKDKVENNADDNPGSDTDNEEEDFDAMADSVLPQTKRFDASDPATPSTSKKDTSNISPGKGKRKLESDTPPGTVKRGKSGGGESAKITSSADGRVDEEGLVRRYLSRKPFTSKELLRKLTRQGVPTEGINTRLGEIMKRLNPQKLEIKKKDGDKEKTIIQWQIMNP